MLRNAYMKAVRQTARGAEDPYKAYVISAHQHDPSTARKLVEKLLLQGIEVHVAEGDFVADDTLYGAGSYVVPSAQPKYGVIKSLLAQTFYPDNAWTREKDGSPRAPRDMATDTMPEFMGVKVVPVSCVPQAKLTRVEEAKRPVGGIVGKSKHGYALDPRQNLSYRAATALLAAGTRLRRASEPVQCGGVTLPAGAFIAEPDRKLLENVASSLGATFHAVSGEPESAEVRKPRVGLYQRYYGGNADEGWTRFVLEEFGFEYETLRDDGVDGGLRGRLDVVVLPSDPAWAIVGDIEKHFKETGSQPPNVPPEYRSGLHGERVEALVRFVSEGGTLVCLNESSMFAVDAFNLSLGDSLHGLSSKEFFCPASTLHASVDTCHPLGYGMAEDSLLFFWESPAFTVKPCVDSERYEVVARYPDHGILESGWLDGEKHLAGKAALVVARVGSGSVVLFGFRPQHRAQTDGAYKLLFNSLLL